jgi:hypothetical protein
VLTAFGAAAVTFMMLMYALERRHRRYILGLRLRLRPAGDHGFFSGTRPFGVVEAIWAGWRSIASGAPRLIDRTLDNACYVNKKNERRRLLSAPWSA